MLAGKPCSPLEETMKIPSVVSSLGLAISFALPAFAQQKDTANSRIVQQRDLLGVAKALDEFGELYQKLDEAYNKNDAGRSSRAFHGGRTFGGTERDI